MQKERAIGALDHARIVRAQRDEFGLYVIQAKPRGAQETSVIARLLVSQGIRWRKPMSSKIDKSADVLVVGGGGCGLAISIFLADKGVDFLTIERHASTSILPKAHYLNQRTMEIFRQHGLADEVYAKGAPPYNRSKTKWYTSPGGDNPLPGKTIFETGALGGHGAPRIVHYFDTSPTDTANLPRIRREPLIISHAEARDASRIRFSYELVEFSQDAEGVNAKVRDVNTNQTETIRAKYLVAADGGRTVGKTLGVADLPIKVSCVSEWAVEGVLAERYRVDRVFLAGDAAHRPSDDGSRSQHRHSRRP